MAEKCQHGSPSERLTKRPFTLSRRRMQQIASGIEGPFTKEDWNAALEEEGFYLTGKAVQNSILAIPNLKRIGREAYNGRDDRGLTLYAYVRHEGY